MIHNIWKQRCHASLDPKLHASLFHSVTKTLAPASKLVLDPNEVEEENAWRWKKEEDSSHEEECSFVEKEQPKLHISHPWPEWIDLMKCLLNNGYFHDADANHLGAKQSNLIRTACLNFGRDHFDLLRFLSRKDIGVTVALGCPSLDRKVINSGKRLRAHVGIDEGNVCSSCDLRGDCERALVKAREDVGGRTVDVMRIILTYGLNPIIGSVENKRCLTKKVEESVRRLLKEIVEHSAEEKNHNFPDATKDVVEEIRPSLQDKGKIDVHLKQGDWLCPECNFANFARNVRCLRCDSLNEEKIKQFQEDNNHLPLKKGDWICNTCNFLNFAKNTRCLRCKEKPPKRHLNPGEWECDSCNYINFRRNMICLKCDHRRPKASNASNSPPQPQHEDKDQRWRSDKSPMLSERKNRSRDSHLWTFVEDRMENHESVNKSNDPFQFMDFPIAGGKTHVSEAQRREASTNEFLNQDRRPSWQSDTDDDEFCSADNQSTDDEEMGEWFGRTKNERCNSGKNDFDNMF